MKHHFRSIAFGVCALFAVTVSAQEFPTRPITMVVPYPPGGATDTLARIVSKSLTAQFGQAVVVENKAGAGTIIGAQYVANAAPDGYTILITGNTTFTINAALKSKLPYDPLKSFTPLATIGGNSLVMLANLAVPASNVKEVVAMAAKDPGKHGFGTFGLGTSTHFAGEMFQTLSNTKLNHVPYKGSAPAMADLLGGQIPFTFDTTIAAGPQLAASKVKAIAVTTKARSRSLPTVPTFAESGYPEFDLSIWIALVAPKGLPEAVRAKLEKALAEVTRDPISRAELEKTGLDVDFKPGAAYEPAVVKETAVLKSFVQRAGIPVE
ncbi:MAG: tripartite tricarboxylate transporter substrate binding protein [Casimicrobium sp.]